MAKGARVGDDGVVTIDIALTTSGCPLRAQIQKDVRARVGTLPGVTKVKIDVGRAHQGGEGRGHGQGPLQHLPGRTRHHGPCHHQGDHGRLGQGRGGQVVGHGQHRRRSRRQGLHRRRHGRRHLGLLGATHVRCRRPSDRRRPNPRRSPLTNAGGRRAPQGRLDGLPRRERVDLAELARPHPQPGGAALPRRRAVGRDGLPAHRHAAGHRRRPDGSGEDCCREPT